MCATRPPRPKGRTGGQYPPDEAAGLQGRLCRCGGNSPSTPHPIGAVNSCQGAVPESVALLLWAVEGDSVTKAIGHWLVEPKSVMD